jgi:hypothetical protein
MPEMVRYCGMSFTVLQRADKTCALNSEMQRLDGVITLENIRCDGIAHGGCQLRCMIFWKEAWLERCKPGEPADDEPTPDCESVSALRTERRPGVYFCQATELTRASTGDLPRWSPMQYIRDMRSRTFTPLEFVKAMIALLVEKITLMIFTRHATRRSGEIEGHSQEVLNLQPGERVEVKSRKEILASLDGRGGYRGLGFTTDMFACSGRRYCAKERIERIIHETTGEMRHVKNTVMLEGAVCDRHRGCGRRMYFLWREIWLRRV